MTLPSTIVTLQDRLKARMAQFLVTHRKGLKKLVPFKGPVLLSLREFKMYVRLDDWVIGARIAVRRTYEPHVMPVVRPLLRRGMVFVDIGANIGFYTLLAASKAGEEGKVIAFEPARCNLELLEKSIAINRFKNIIIHPFAVADEEKTLGLTVDDSNGSVRFGEAAKSCEFEVRAVPLDHILRDEPRIDMLKMDIEGAEWHALQGMKELLKKHRPIILSEFSPEGLKLVSGIQPERYLTALRELGYRFFSIHRLSGLSPTEQSNQQIMDLFNTRDVYDHVDLLARPS